MTTTQKQPDFSENASIIPEQNLWKSVVTQAVRDAFSNDHYHRWSAWAWFHGDTNDYRWTCQLAGIAADRLRQTMIETVFLNYLIQKGGFIMNKGTKNQFKYELPKSKLKIRKSRTTLSEKFDIARRAKAIFRAIYSQQELDKAIGSLTLNDILKICEQSDFELNAEAELEADNG
jgi:hypothetical protein